MKIAITGGTGFVGKELTRFLIENGDEVFILTRSPKPSTPQVTYVEWLSKGSAPAEQLEGIDAIVNLAGSSINDGRWSKEQQWDIYDSRMTATKEILRIIAELDQKPKVLVNASAVGIYPASENVTYTEASADVGTDFLAKTVVDWEKLSSEAEQFGVRVNFARFGIILGKEDGALPLMALPYKMFAGGTVGTGNQWLSWVHINDIVRAIHFAIVTEELSGPFNVTAPNPKRMKEFGKQLAKALNRPHWIPVPSFALKAALGKKSRLVLQGQRVLPEVLERHGFQFQFPDLQSALADLYK
ncbi:MAG TPA: TIGR01777 family oxidoreductase [Planococcus sp. (in: firmicutes)]|nr:TIGR01777 family oxidoreductase [Planococcus sp. (in: firmicutes)]